MRADSPLRDDLKEVQEITQSTLTKVRGLSQALHPVLLEEAGTGGDTGLYIPTVNGRRDWPSIIKKAGAEFPVETAAGVHLYRVVQESLNNVNRACGNEGSVGAIDLRAARVDAGD